MRNRNQQKTEAKYRRQKDKEYLDIMKMLALLAKSDGLQQLNSGFSLSNANSRITFYMLFFYYMLPLPVLAADLNTGDDSPFSLLCENSENGVLSCKSDKYTQSNLHLQSSNIKFFVHRDPGTNSEDCSYIVKSLERINKLPGTDKLIQKVVHSDGFNAICKLPGQISGSSDAAAAYSPQDNTIMFQSISDAEDSKGDDFIIHHEMIHAHTSLKHQTETCNLRLFGPAEIDHITRLERGGLKHSTLSPIWPPSFKNLQLYMSMINEDIALQKVNLLVALHIKANSNNKLTRNERYYYNLYNQALKGISPITREVLIPTQVVDNYLAGKNPNDPMPLKLLLSNGITYINPRGLTGDMHGMQFAIHDKGSEYRLTAKLAGDAISTFLYTNELARDAYDRYMAKYDFVSACAEMDTHLRMALPESAIQEFYPNLWKHLQKEEACCEQGNTNQCYPGNFELEEEENKPGYKFS